MPASLPYPDRISQGSTRKKTYRTLRAQFGDGYEQTAPDGINSQFDTWSCSLENLNATERNVVWAAFDLVGASDYLTWQPPGYSTVKRWKLIGEVAETPVSGDLYSIAFELKQSF